MTLPPSTITALPNVPARRHDIDALRVLAFGLLILYHCGMVYVADWEWHVKSVYTSAWLQYPMMLSNQWRMPLLFLISGLAMNFLLRNPDDAGTWRQSISLFRSRSARLLVPLLFGMLVIVPPQAYVQALANGATEPGYFNFLLRYFTFQPWPAEAFDGSDIGITWNHLWYLPYLWVYTVILACLLPWLRSARGQSVIARVRSLRGAALWLLPALLLFVFESTLRLHFPQTHNLVWDWNAHAHYFTVFLIGFAFGEDNGIWKELKRLRYWSLLLALCSYVTLVILSKTIPAKLDIAFALKGFGVLSFNQWIWLCAVLGWGHHLLNRPFRWLPYAVDAVFPWYILHQTFIVIAAFALATLQLGPVVEPILVVGITIAGCLLTHEFVVRRIRWLHPLFGMKTRRTDKSYAPTDANGMTSLPGVSGN